MAKWSASTAASERPGSANTLISVPISSHVPFSNTLCCTTTSPELHLLTNLFQSELSSTSAHGVLWRDMAYIIEAS